MANSTLKMDGADSLPCVEHRIPRDGHFLYAREYAGSGPTCVLLHGFPDNLKIYDRLIPLLVDAGRHVVAFDFLGFGSSDKPVGYDYSFGQQLQDLECVADALNLQEVTPVGHDAGGVAAIDYVLAHPERASGLCLLNTFYGLAPSLRLPELLELFTVPGLSALADAMATTPEQIEFLLHFQQSQFKLGASVEQIAIMDNILRPIIDDNFLQQPGAGPAFARLARSLPSQISKNSARVQDFKSIECRTAIIWGQRDTFLASGVAVDFAGKIRGAALHLLDAGHWPQLDLPEKVAGHILKELCA